MRTLSSRKDQAVVQVAERLHSAAIHLLRRLRRSDVATGISAPKLSALSVLVFGGPSTLGELAAAEHVRPPTMSRIISELESDGLVTRRINSVDKRAVRLQATAKGARVLHKGRRLRIAYLADRMADLPKEEVATLMDATQILERLVHDDR